MIYYFLFPQPDEFLLIHWVCTQSLNNTWGHPVKMRPRLFFALACTQIYLGQSLESRAEASMPVFDINLFIEARTQPDKTDAKTVYICQFSAYVQQTVQSVRAHTCTCARPHKQSSG